MIATEAGNLCLYQAPYVRTIAIMVHSLQGFLALTPCMGHYPQGILPVEEEVEEEFEIDINDTEPTFLKGQSAKSGVEVSPIKIVANPDGSLQRAAMTQSALAKERRELREQQQRTLLEAIPKDLSRPWEDPLPEPGERHLAQVHPRCLASLLPLSPRSLS